MIKSLLEQEPQHTIQLSMMLVESITDSGFPSPTESDLTSTVFDLLYKSASRKSILARAMCKLLIEWILIKIQTRQACKVGRLIGELR